jgi:transposase-like protein
MALCQQQQEERRSRQKFTDEFKRDAAALVLDTGRPIAQDARELDVYESS